MTQVRKANSSDAEAIRKVHLAAFPDSESALVSTLAVDLLSEEETLSLLGLNGEVVVAHVAFSPVTISGSDNLQAAILAPLGILPAYQKQGLGTQLTQQGMDILKAQGVHLLFVYGDPAYYGRFGFTNNGADVFTPAFPLEYPFGWQVVSLNSSQLPSESCELSFVQPLSNPALW
ncbi:MAG: N-acetyltransferase [Cellvibrionaceae bacterium]